MTVFTLTWDDPADASAVAQVLYDAAVSGRTGSGPDAGFMQDYETLSAQIERAESEGAVFG